MNAPLILQGAPALSKFRIEKVLQELQAEFVIGLSTRFIHVIDVDAPLTDEELNRLKVILTYGPSTELSDGFNREGNIQRFVVPRPGTI